MSGQATKDRIFGAVMLASLIAGLIAGISARIVMRIVALTAHMPLSFTEASLNMVFFGFTLGMIAGFVYAPTIVALSASPKIRKYLPGPIWNTSSEQKHVRSTASHLWHHAGRSRKNSRPLPSWQTSSF
jgi:hypothetical protein